MFRLYILLASISGFLLLLSSCAFYKQDIMLRTKTEEDEKLLLKVKKELSKDYLYKKGDLIYLLVYDNNGEQLVDNTGLLKKSNNAVGGVNGQNMLAQRQLKSFIVKEDGKVNLPLVGDYEIAGKSRQIAEQELRKLYSEFYKESFVIVNIIARRAYFINGAQSSVINLDRENMTIFDAIALAGGIEANSKVSNIRLVREENGETNIYSIDLSTITSASNSLIDLKPDDVIYVEPGRRPILDALNDYLPLLTITTQFVTIVLLFTR